MQISVNIHNMYRRIVETQIEEYLAGKDKHILLMWGPRRSGKTTVMKRVADKLGVRLYNFDFVTDREKFEPRREVLARIVKENRVAMIDEVQNYPEATVMMKLLHDEWGIKVIATGSSELRQKSKEFDTLAGRYREIYCLPLSLEEIYLNEKPRSDDEKEFFVKTARRMQKYGAYPEVWVEKDRNEKEVVEELTTILNAYVLKDVVSIYNLKDEKLAKDILTKIALQLGSEVSIREIANSLNANASTVANYIEVFIKNYVLVPLPAFKTNKRRAVSENRKLYFVDLGVRNMLIEDFRESALRSDKGGVFENMVVAELAKAAKVGGSRVKLYFYREYGGKEVDLVVEDWKKRYITAEIKAKDGKVREVFPYKARKMVVNPKNYFESVGTLAWFCQLRAVQREKTSNLKEFM